MKLAGGGKLLLLNSGTKVGRIQHGDANEEGNIQLLGVVDDKDWWDFGQRYSTNVTSIPAMGVSPAAVFVLAQVDEPQDEEDAAGERDAKPAAVPKDTNDEDQDTTNTGDITAVATTLEKVFAREK